MVHYIGYYEEVVGEAKRNVFLSAVNKMKYIAHAMACQKIESKIISCAMSKNETAMEQEEQKSADGISIFCFKSYGRRNAVTKLLDKVGMPVQLLLYLCKNVKKNDTLLVYHSLNYCNTVRFFSALKKCTLILEMEEIYSDVIENPKRKRTELVLAEKADSFIFPTQLLNDAVNSADKPFTVVHGTYQAEPDRGYRFDDGNIHVVYAGTLDPRKGGAVAAASAAEHLPPNYHVHILGFGSEEQIQEMKALAAAMSAKSAAQITYDGLLSGEDYIRFIQACDIGLSTQNPDAAFNDTSFPSKVLSYMANGLHVVSVRIKAVETSAVGDMITYYDTQTPECIAKAIMSVDMAQPYDSRKRIAELDEQFQKELKQLIEAK